MSLWSRLKDTVSNVFESVADFVVPKRELPKKVTKPRGKRRKFIPLETPQRELPGQKPSVSRETPRPAFVEKLQAIRSERQQIQDAERRMFDTSLSDSDRKEALKDYTELTGWYRPDNNNAWSSDEWKKWEEIYEPEPESF